MTVFASDFTADMIQGAPVTAGLGWAVANTIEPALGAAALRLAFRREIPNFESVRAVVYFLATAAIAGPPLASLIGATTTSAVFDQAFFVTWRDWYVGDVLGILVVAPVFFYLHKLRGAFDRALALVMLAAIAGAAAIFLEPLGTGVVFLYMLMPILLTRPSNFAPRQ